MKKVMKTLSVVMSVSVIFSYINNLLNWDVTTSMRKKIVQGTIIADKSDMGPTIGVDDDASNINSANYKNS